MYEVFLAILVGMGTVFGLSLVGALWSNYRKKTTLIIAGIVGAVYSTILALIYWYTVVSLCGPAPLLFSILIGAGIAAFIAGINEESWKGALPGLAVIGIYGFIYALMIVVVIDQGSWFKADRKAALIGHVGTREEKESALDPADTAKICLVSEEMARIKAQEALSQFKLKDDATPGSRYLIGKPTQQFVDGAAWWIFPLEFGSHWKWKAVKEVPGYLRVSCYDPFAKAEPIQHDKKGNEIHIRYLNSASWEFKAVRHLRRNGYRYTILDDWTFELDDNWRPHLTVSAIERDFGFRKSSVHGVVVLDTQTGKFEFQSLDRLDPWIDRGMPLNILDYQICMWGKYSRKPKFWSVLWNKDKSIKPTLGWYLTYDQEGNARWFSGFTSMSTSDEALIGFTISEARTGRTIYYRTEGITESVAKSAAESDWSNFAGYDSAMLVLYNIYGRLTYVIPIAYEGKFVGVSLVSMSNVNIKGSGKTLDSALSKYRVAIAVAASKQAAPESGEKRVIALAGTIAYVGQSLIQGGEQIFLFTLVGEEKIFHAVYGFSSAPKVPFMQPGLQAEITYVETGESIVTCQTFDLPAIKLAEPSPTQIRHDQEIEHMQKTP